MWFDNIKLLIFISHYKNGFNLQSLPGGITFRKLAINAVKIIKYTQLLQVYNTYLTYLLSYSGIYDPWYFLQKLTDTKQYLCHHSVYMWHVRVICLANFDSDLCLLFTKSMYVHTSHDLLSPPCNALYCFPAATAYISFIFSWYIFTTMGLLSFMVGPRRTTKKNRLFWSHDKV